MMQSPALRPQDDLADKRYYGLLLLLLAAYAALRAAAWSNTVLFEDHDSILYIQQILAYLSFDVERILALSPDSTLFYPLFGALVSLPGWSAEFGARLCSFVFSIAVFVAACGILDRIADRRATLIGLAILCFHPYLIKFSIAILSEPVYVAVVYLGLWYYLARHDSRSLWHAAGLGAVFGMTFLNRVEGLLFLLLVPFWQTVYLNTVGRPPGQPRARAWRSSAGWASVYILAFAAIASLQIAMVSYKMDGFALNGRQVWADILLTEDDRSYEEKIYGLDHSPTEINLTYIQSHRSTALGDHAGPSLAYYAERFLRNVDKFYQVRIGELGGSLLVAYFLFGLVAVFAAGLRFEAFVLITFAGAVVFPAILAAPITRALAVVVPVLAIVSGPGILHASDQLVGNARRSLRLLVPAALLLAILAAWSVPLLGTYFQERRANAEYSLDELQPFVERIRSMPAAATGDGLTISSRKQYLPYLSGTEFVPLPYADFEQLVSYARANGVELLFLQHRLIDHFPFIDRIRNGDVDESLELVYSDLDSSGMPLELYRIR